MNAWYGLPLLVCSLPLRAGVMDCIPAAPLDLMVRIGEAGTVQRLQLIGGASPPLRLQQPDGGAVVWSAASAEPATQRFDSLWAGFSGSLAALDLDGDGLHDRVYAGDLAGRLWRFDIHNGSPADALLTGGIFASLGGIPALRAFVVPPDLSLSTNAGTKTLNIAVGTASLMPGTGLNRFYVLHERSPDAAWSQAQYDRWRPIQEADLAWINDPAHGAGTDASLASSAGFYVTLAGSDIVLRSITVSGHAILAVVPQPGSGDDCSVAVTVSSLSLDDGRPVVDFDGNGVVARNESLPLPGYLPAGSDFSLTTSPDGTEAVCRLGDSVIAGCSFSTRLVPTWWRREDAD